jgi:hypothetical protein
MALAFSRSLADRALCMPVHLAQLLTQTQDSAKATDRGYTLLNGGEFA